jgi:SAM-dependent methyltransferase
MPPRDKMHAAATKIRAVQRCRVCNASGLQTYLDLGKTPLANAYRRRADLKKPEFSAPLAIQLCSRCGLSQLTHVVPPARMFRHYLYASSTPKTFRDHCAALSRDAIARAKLRRGEWVLDIASNDGCLLSYFKKRGQKVIGVDPALNLGREARRKGIPTLSRYWNTATVNLLRRRYGLPRVIVSTNVLAHVHDAHDFTRNVARALAPDGLWIFEVPYVLDFIRRNEFDTAYHEHLSYFGVEPLGRLLEAHGLALFDVDYFPTLHGGTLRGWVSRPGRFKVTSRVRRFRAKERRFGVKRIAPYHAFRRRIHANRRRLLALLQRLTRRGDRIWAYGAGAKGNTLLNVFGITRTHVDKIIDDNARKWGLYTPGSHLPITGIGALKNHPPDYLLILAWNFSDEIVARCRRAGYKGAFIRPVPVPEVLA